MFSPPSFASRVDRRWLLAPLNDGGAWNRLLQRINPTWSLTETRARVVARVDESVDTMSLWLEPNRRWRGHRPGQHVLLGAEVDGVWRRRVFSLSTAARPDGLLRVTLQRQRRGGMTEWLHARAREGLVVEIGGANGAFVLPDPVPERLLMIAGGSGITPLLAMLHGMAEASSGVDIELFQLYRSSDQRLFADELSELAGRLPGLRIHPHCSGEHGRLSPQGLVSRVPDLAQRRTLLCGPEPLMADFVAAWERLGLEAKLQTECFGAPRPVGDSRTDVQVFAAESEQTFTQDAGQSLLEAAEAAGLQPKFGCRAGLCRSCLCNKRSGQTRNLLTGLVSSQPDEWVQLCVSVAESDLELSL